MLANVVDFFRNLPPKECAQCGNKIDEQHECYGIYCEKCNVDFEY